MRKFGEGRVADALLEKWLVDDAGDEGFRRLNAMVSLWPLASLSRMADVDSYTPGQNSYRSAA